MSRYAPLSPTARGPAQRIAPPSDRAVPAARLRPARPRRRGAEAEVRRLIAGGRPRPFDLANGPLLRAALLLLAAEESVLLFSTHHIVSDAWSMSVLVREVAVLYEVFAAGRPSPLPELPVQYADFAALAARLARGRGARRPSRLLDPPSRRRTAGARAAGRPPASGAPVGPRPAAPVPPPRRCRGRSCARQEGGDHLHDDARRVRRPARPPVRPERGGGRHADGGARPLRDRGAHRLLHQRPAAAPRPVAEPDLPRAAAAGARGLPRRLRPPGAAAREAGRGAGDRAAAGPLAPVPGHLRPAERPRGGRRAAGAPLPRWWSRTRPCASTSPSGCARRAPGWGCSGPSIPTSSRPRPSSASAGPLRGPARGGGRLPGDRDRPPGRAERRRAGGERRGRSGRRAVAPRTSDQQEAAPPERLGQAES